MSAHIIVHDQNNHNIHFHCTWSNGGFTSDPSGSSSWASVNLFIKTASTSPDFSWPSNKEEVGISISSSTDDRRDVGARDFGSSEAFGFLLDALAAADAGHGSVVKFVVPQTRGYIIRSDIIPKRLLDCPLVVKTVGLAKVHQLYDREANGTEDLHQLSDVFAAAAGGMLVKACDPVDGKTVDALLASLDDELRNRLSFPWLSAQSAGRKTLAIVDGGISSPDNGGTGESVYMAARALGIDMVVLDSPNHWVNGPRYTNWRKATVPLECPLHPDAEFVDRIVEAVRSYDGSIDGIVSLRDHYKHPVAEAALRLSLPTYLPSAYEIATDKFKTSISEGHHAYVASSSEQALAIVQEHHLSFPLITKPTNGFLSEGVFRAESAEELEAGIKTIHTDRHGCEFVIEKYCEGPEVDANLVLCDGEVIFFEVSDDFPKGADANGDSSLNTFIEVANVLPSKLPESELSMLKEELAKSLIRMGFRDGFFHLEARVESSSMNYVTENGILDLAESKTAVQQRPTPSSWLIEVNPRPPGIQASSAVEHTYGVDYFALALLFALDDKERVKQLSHPFLQGPQYWCEMVFIPVEKGGVYDSGDVCTELFERRPDLAAHVSRSFCFLRKGDKVADPSTGINSWVAYFNVFSRTSREDLLRIADAVRQEVSFSII
ncbi:hypothetical protein BDV25DRAFT_157925 [Aspergillus avenaceus]|uniref:ATP-grasp enzyme aveB n=1 Tax=Aspergillus avenaceus TaxID=36643 RepID=AVEB_ASPAV|nr:hypothetical protein BDV25DRAFT_157925 [Aspergillus avenaceus]